MSIIKTSFKEHPFAQIDKRMLENPALSWRAKGLLSYLLSKPDNWQIRTADLIAKSVEGRDAVYSILKELIKARYIITEQALVQGKFAGVNYTVYEVPLTGLPYTVEPDPVAPDPAKPDHSNNNNSNIEFSNNESFGADFIGWFLKTFNRLTKKGEGRGHRMIDTKTRENIIKLLKAGYKKTDFEDAIKNAHENEYHVSTGHTYLTPEFICRPVKFEQYLNANNGGSKKPNNPDTKPVRTSDSGGKKDSFD